MNYSTAIFLINKSVRAVRVSYEPDPANPEKYAGSLTTLKTFDQIVTKGDFVVVPTDTRWKMTVCRVEEVDVEVDLESGVQIGWLVTGAMDRSEYEAVLAQEASAILAIKSAEKRRKQEELREALIKDNPELNSLADVGHGAVLTAPVRPDPLGEEF